MMGSTKLSFDIHVVTDSGPKNPSRRVVGEDRTKTSVNTVLLLDNDDVENI